MIAGRRSRVAVVCASLVACALVLPARAVTGPSAIATGVNTLAYQIGISRITITDLRVLGRLVIGSNEYQITARATPAVIDVQSALAPVQHGTLSPFTLSGRTPNAPFSASCGPSADGRDIVVYAFADPRTATFVSSCVAQVGSKDPAPLQLEFIVDLDPPAGRFVATLGLFGLGTNSIPARIGL